MKTAIIIDDEKHCISNLKYELEKHCPDVEVVASCTNPREGASLLEEHNPDILFLDIEMPWMSGFEFLKTLPELNFKLVFVTAYDQYAIKAFKFSAIDYLLKPVSGQDLKLAVAKVNKKQDDFNNDHLNVLLNNLKEEKKEAKLVLPTAEGLEFVQVEDIVRCASDSNYCSIYLSSGRQIFLAKTLKEIEALLSNYTFYRVHNSHLISERYIKKYIHAEGGGIEMKDGSLVPISRQRKASFLEKFK